MEVAVLKKDQQIQKHKVNQMTLLFFLIGSDWHVVQITSC